MNNDINLLHTVTSHRSPQLARRMRIFRTISVTFLFLVVTSSIVLFLLTTFSPLPRIQDQEKELLLEFSSGSLQQKTDSYFLTKVRVGDITKLLANRSRLLDGYTIITDTFSGGITIKTLNAEKEKMIVSVSSVSLLDLQNAIDKMSEVLKSDKKIDSIFISNIEFGSSDGVYTADIEIVNKI